MSQGKFESTTAEGHLEDFHKQQRQDLANLLRRLAQSDAHKDFSNNDAALILMSVEFAGIDVVAMLLKAESAQMREVKEAKDFLQQILFPKETQLGRISGPYVDDLLRRIADELEAVDGSGMFRQVNALRRTMMRVSEA